MKSFNQHTWIWVTLISLFLWTGCTPQQSKDEEPELPELKLSIKELSLTKAQSVGNIEVNSVQENWNCMIIPSSATWLTAERKNNEIIVTAQPNTTGTARKAKVMVTSGGTTAYASVTQSASDLVLNLKEPKVTLNAQNGHKIIEVLGNDDSWTLEPLAADVQWLRAESISKSGIIILHYKSNDKDKPRNTTLTIRKRDGSKVLVEVTQIAQLTYFLPYEGNRKDLVFVDLIAHEEKRGFELGTFIKAQKGFLSVIPDYLQFHTNSSALPTITYTRPLDFKYPLMFDKIAVELSDRSEVLKGGGYREWLLSHGFKLMYGSNENEPVFESEDGFYMTKLSKDKFSGVSYLNFIPQLLQDGPMPTFSKYPYVDETLYSHITDPNWKFAQVDAWHTARGDEKTLDVPAPIHKYKHALALYKVKNGAGQELIPEHFWYEFYYITNNTHDPTPEYEESVKLLRLAFNDYKKIIFMVGKHEFKVTREFKALAESEGFIYTGIENRGVSFVNRKRDLRLLIQVAFEPDFLGSEITALLAYERINEFDPKAKPTIGQTNFMQVAPMVLSKSHIFKYK